LDTGDSSYIISLVWKGTLYIANFGDSRLMICTEVGDTSVLNVEQLTTDKSLKLKIIIKDDDMCIILASGGFWNIMNNEETMLIVERHSKHVILFNLFFYLLVQIIIGIKLWFILKAYYIM
jgi:serine/threonine protein phosphatase PrpC